MNRTIGLSKLEMGVCYYPEHWDSAMWPEDLRRMLASGIGTVRIAEFAWSCFEPTEGCFTFELFDRFMALCEQTGMKVIFCTPTATPPAWLTRRYPEVLNVDYDGHQHHHGLRRQYNYNAEAYREKTRVIVKKLGEHYGRHPMIVGWQLDNELNNATAEFYSEADQAAFRIYLKQKYQTLDALNAAWGARFWNQTYADWAEVSLPAYNFRHASNPHQKLDSIRFFAWSVHRYTKLQHDALRRFVPADRYITTNGMFPHMDYDQILQDGALDFLMFDSYPASGLSTVRFTEKECPLRDRMWSQKLAKVRAISPCFGVMEQQSGPGGWSCFAGVPTPRPGQIRLWTMQSIAHGADYISYFRWRTCTFGTEIYWHGILGYDNRDNARLAEVRRTREDMRRIEDVAGGRYVARVAILRDYDNEWDGEHDQWHGQLRGPSDVGLYTACQRLHIPCDYVNLDADETSDELLAGYSLLIYPHATLLAPRMAERLENYVRRGGTLVTGARSGYKDKQGHCLTEPMPGPLRNLLGMEVEDFSCLPGQTATVALPDGELPVELFIEALRPTAETCQSLARYASGMYEGQPALTENRFGKGKAYAFGSCFTPKIAEALLRLLSADEPYADALSLPEGCELAIRQKDGQQYWFVLNYADEPAAIVLRRSFTDALTGEQKAGECTLPPFSVLVLRSSVHSQN